MKKTALIVLFITAVIGAFFAGIMFGGDGRIDLQKNKISNQEYLEAGAAIEYLGYTTKDYISAKCPKEVEKRYVAVCKKNSLVTWIAGEAKKKNIQASQLIDKVYDEIAARKAESVEFVKENLELIAEDYANYDYAELRESIEKGKASKTYYIIEEYEELGVYQLPYVIELSEALEEWYKGNSYKEIVCLAYGDMEFRQCYAQYAALYKEFRIKSQNLGAEEWAKKLLKLLKTREYERFKSMFSEVSCEKHIRQMLQ